MKDLPTYPGPKSAALRPIDAGGWQEAVLGGDDIRLDRLGNRFGLAVTMPPMKWDTIDGVSAARVWASRLTQGIEEGVRMEVPQPDFDLSSFDDGTARPTGAVAAQASEFAGSWLGAGRTYYEGQLVTVVRTSTGKRYLHQLREGFVVDGGGLATVKLWPRLRTPLDNTDRLNFATPTIDGRLVDPQPFDMTEIRTIGVAFDVQEVA